MADSLVWAIRLSDRRRFGNEIHYYARSISIPANIFPNDRTIQQLKSSGSLRLIRNITVSNAIMSYDQQVRNTQYDMLDESAIRSEYRQVVSSVFNTLVFYEIVSDAISFRLRKSDGLTEQVEILARPNSNPQLISNDPILLNRLIGTIQDIKRIQVSQLVRSMSLKKQAAQLIDLIKKEYNLN